MVDMSWEHAAEARAALNAIVTDPEHGVAALSSAQTMSNLLKDLLPDAPREKSMLVAAAEAGLASSLRDHVAQGMDPGTAIRLTASTFSATTPFTPEACSWVAGEIAIALGISTPGAAGGAAPFGGAPGPAGQLGGTPPAFDQLGQGVPTQMPVGFSPGPADGYPQAPAPGYPQAPAPGYPQAPAPGYQQAPGYPAAPTQAAPPGPGQGYPQGYPQQVSGQGGGFAGGGFAGGGAQQAPPAAWQGGGAYGPGGGIPGGPARPRSSRRGLFVVIGFIVGLVVIIVVAVNLLGGSKKPNASGSTTPPATTPAQSTSPTPPASSTPPTASGVEPLTTIMNPAGLTPVGTSCVRAITNGLNAATLTGRLFCDKTTVAKTVVWGYQFDNRADYLAGLAHLNSYTGFSSTSPGSSCPPPSGSSAGSTGWHANSNPKYVARAGQTLECSYDNNKPILIWTMPTQNVIFVGQIQTKGASLTTLVNWWKTLNYG